MPGCCASDRTSFQELAVDWIRREPFRHLGDGGVVAFLLEIDVAFLPGGHESLESEGRLEHLGLEHEVFEHEQLEVGIDDLDHALARDLRVAEVERLLGADCLGRDELAWARFRGGPCLRTEGPGVAIVREHPPAQALLRSVLGLAKLHLVPGKPLDREAGRLGGSEGYLHNRVGRVGHVQVLERDHHRRREGPQDAVEVAVFGTWLSEDLDQARPRSRQGEWLSVDGQALGREAQDRQVSSFLSGESESSDTFPHTSGRGGPLPYTRLTCGRRSRLAP